MDDPGFELMQRIQAGDAEAFDIFIKRYDRTLRAHLERYVSPADADDLLQELWLRVWRRAEQWNAKGKLLSWLIAIATNLALNHLRSRRAHPIIIAIDEIEPEKAPAELSDALLPGPEEEVLRSEQVGRIYHAMRLLPADKQAVLQLVRIEGRSLREAAEILDVPIGTVKSRIHHAQKMLMEYLEEE